KMDRAGRAGRRQLYDAAAVPARQVGVQPPPQALVEALRAIDVRHGHDDDLEFHVDHPGAEYCTWLCVTTLCAAHCSLPAGCCSACAASSPRLAPSIRLNAGNGWMTSASDLSGTPSLIARTSSPRISPARGVTSVAPINTRRSRSAMSFSAPL